MNERPVGEIIIYQAENGRATLEVRLEQETIWLDAHQMAKLFERDRSVIVRHIRNIYETKELSRDSTCAKNAQVAADGKTRFMDLYGRRTNKPKRTEIGRGCEVRLGIRDPKALNSNIASLTRKY